MDDMARGDDAVFLKHDDDLVKAEPVDQKTSQLHSEPL